MKLVIAVLFVAALFWLIKPTQSPSSFNNSTQRTEVQTVQAKPVETRPQMKVEEKAPTEPQPSVEIAAVAQPEPQPTPPEPGTPEALMAAAGIPKSDWAAVDYIVHRESTWRTDAVNASSGSCGLVQELPCGKSGCTLGDGVCQLKWATNYATARYGGWWGAQAFWASAHWW